MTGKKVLEMQLTGSFNIVGDRLAMVTDQEWIAREIPGTSLLGFTFWRTALDIVLQSLRAKKTE